MMTVAELVARLRADTSNFDQGMNRAERRLDSFGGKAGQTLSVLSNMSARFDATVAGMTVAATGLATSLAAVGANYNTLLQKTNAAFESVLGNAQRADKMVADLTAFARESPFPRQVFISATQQLLGFGMAAEKVIPSFEAIQDAVAATGGGAAEIQQFTDIFAQIKSLGKANTDVLMRFSYAGIDAFKLLADQSGVSVAEMREQVTNGMLGADAAIGMLTTGLTEKFDGAAAGVKATWLGTKDRIAGAWRDIGAALVAPFIDPNGGGMLVTIGNELGDLLRLIANDYAPAAGKAIKGFVDEWRPMIEDFDAKEFMESAIDLFDRMKGSLSVLAPILAGVGAGFMKQGLGMIPFVGGLVEALPLPGKLAGALIGLALSSEESRAALMKVGDSLQENLADLLPKIMPSVEALIENLAALIPPLVEIAAHVVEAGWPVFVAGMQAAMTVANGVLMALQPLAEIMAAHPGLVQAIVVAWAGFKVASLISSLGSLTVRMQSLAAAQHAVTRATTAGIGIQGGAASMAAINANMAKFGTLAGAGAAATGTLRASLAKLGSVAGPMLLVTAFLAISDAIADTNARAEAFFQETMADVDLSSLDAMEESLAHIRDRIEEIKAGALDESGTKGMFDWVTKPGDWAIEKLGIGNINDGTDKGLKQHEEQQRSIQRTMAYTSAASVRLGRAWDIMSASVAKSLNPIDSFTSKTAGALLAIGALQDQILENSAATTAAMQGAVDPAAIWGSMATPEMADMPSLARDLAAAQRDAEDAAYGVTDAQERVNEVLGRQFDATEAATGAIDSYLNAQRAAIDPIFAMIRASTEAQKVAQDVARSIRDGNNITMDPGADLLQRAEANMGLDSAAVRLAADIQTGRTSFNAVAAQVEGWVARGTLEAQQASELLAKVQEAINTGNSLGGATATRVISEGIAADRAEFEQQQARDLQEARRALEDAVVGAQEAQRGVQEAAAAINGVSLDGFTSTTGEVVQSLTGMMDQMEAQISDMLTWQSNIRKIAQRGGADLAMEIQKWGPQAAGLVAEIANATAPEFDRFATLTKEKMALSGDALETELQAMKLLAEQYGPETVNALVDEFGLTPGKLGEIMTRAKDDFEFVMQMLAQVAEDGGRTSALALARTMSDELGMNFDDVYAKIQEYGGAFGWLGDQIQTTAQKIAEFFSKNTSLTDGSIAARDRVTQQVSNPLAPLAGMTKDDLENLQRMKNGGYTDAELAKFFEAVKASEQVGPRQTQTHRVINGAFADGGIRMPKIAHGIQFAEPETHGEAYIPLALSKRARSKALVGQVAGIFGMNEDQEPASGDGSGGQRNHNEFTAIVHHYGPDSGADRAVRELEKMSYRSGWGD